MKGKLVGVYVSIADDQLDPRGNVGEGEAEFLERLNAGTAGWLSLVVEVKVAVEKGAGAKIERFWDSLGGVSVLNGSSEERKEMKSYLRSVLMDEMLPEAGGEAHKRTGVDYNYVKALGMDAIENALASDDGKGKAEV